MTQPVGMRRALIPVAQISAAQKQRSTDAVPDVLSTQQLSVCLGQKPVLHGLNLGFAKGRWTCVVGPNGAGKSTLLKALAGLIPYQGQVLLAGQDLRSMALKRRAQQIAWLGHSELGDQGSAGASLGVYDTVMLGRLPWQSWFAPPSEADRAAVTQAMMHTQVWPWRDRTLCSLSGGERQRVLLARALAVQAPVLLMDEPLSNVDAPHQADWVQRVRALTAQGTTVVSVVHELNIALTADAIVMLQAGRLVYSGEVRSAQCDAALEALFDHRIVVRPCDGQRVAVLKGL